MDQSEWDAKQWCCTSSAVNTQGTGKQSAVSRRAVTAVRAGIYTQSHGSSDPHELTSPLVDKQRGWLTAAGR